LNEFKVPNAWWPISLIDSIQQIDLSLVIPWVASCIIHTLEYEVHARTTLIVDRVRRTLASTSTEEVQHLLDEYDHELHEDGNNLLVSYRNLTQAKKFLLANDVIGVRTQVAWSLIHLGECEYTRRTNIEFILASYSRLISGHDKRAT